MKPIKKTLFRAFSFLCLCLSANLAFAQIIVPSPPQINAKSYILLDADTGSILVQHNADERLPPASLTKMMTAYLVEKELASGNIGIDDKVLISKKAWQMKGSLMFLEVGEKVPVGELLKGVIIVSGNDASVALSEYVAGGEDSFANLMNSTAEQIGMKNTHFVNASGYPVENHYSTAHDLAILARHIVEDYPQRYSVYKQKYFQYGVDKATGKPLNPQPNRNSLLWSNPSVDGLKTGHTNAAGYCLTASALQEGRRLIAVVMGTKSSAARANETQKLLTYGFRFFDNIKVEPGKVALEKPRIYKGSISHLPVGLNQDLLLTVPKGTKGNIKAQLDITKPLLAPVKKGQQIGTVQVTLGNKVVKQEPLLALQDVPLGGFFSRLWDMILLWFV